MLGEVGVKVAQLQINHNLLDILVSLGNALLSHWRRNSADSGDTTSERHCDHTALPRLHTGRPTSMLILNQIHDRADYMYFYNGNECANCITSENLFTLAEHHLGPVANKACRGYVGYIMLKILSISHLKPVQV